MSGLYASDGSLVFPKANPSANLIAIRAFTKKDFDNFDSLLTRRLDIVSGFVERLGPDCTVSDLSDAIVTSLNGVNVPIGKGWRHKPPRWFKGADHSVYHEEWETLNDVRYVTKQLQARIENPWLDEDKCLEEDSEARKKSEGTEEREGTVEQRTKFRVIHHLVRLAASASPTPLTMREIAELGQRWVEVVKPEDLLEKLGMDAEHYKRSIWSWAVLAHDWLGKDT